MRPQAPDPIIHIFVCPSVHLNAGLCEPIIQRFLQDPVKRDCPICDPTWSTVTELFLAKFWRIAVRKDWGKKNPPSQKDSGFPRWNQPRKKSTLSPWSQFYLKKRFSSSLSGSNSISRMTHLSINFLVLSLICIFIKALRVQSGNTNWRGKLSTVHLLIVL